MINATSTDEQPSTKNTNNTELNSELIKRTEIKDTPFTVITIEGKSFGSMGQYRITEIYNNEETPKKEVQKITWNRLIQVIMLLQEQKDITLKKV